jgi:hypothetical protein
MDDMLNALSEPEATPNSEFWGALAGATWFRLLAKTNF